jgi:DNA primase
MLSKISESLNYLLNNYLAAESCRNYIDSRISKDSQNIFQYGYFPGVDNINVLTDLIDYQDLLKSNLIYIKNIEDSIFPRKINISSFENHPLILPFKDPYGKITAFVGRSLLSDKERGKIDKYRYSKDFKKSHHLFGIFENKRHILEQDCAYIVEGQLDVIKAYEKGFRNVVAIGSASMSIHQFSLITRYTNNIFLLLDNDQAGEKGRYSIIKNFGGYANIHNFYIPEPYKDIDEFLSENSYEDLSLVVKD